MKQTIAAAVLGVALAAAPAFAQNNSAKTQASGDSNGVGGSGSFSGWLSDYQTKHEGRVSRQAYMDEVGRRWDAADKDKRGLTSDQINQAYGTGTSSATAPGNMGPNNVKK
jgi:hypothetical protein